MTWGGGLKEKLKLGVDIWVFGVFEFDLKLFFGYHLSECHLREFEPNYSFEMILEL